MRVPRAALLAAVMACGGCAGRPVALGARAGDGAASPTPQAAPRTVSGEACSFDLYGTLPVANHLRHETAASRLQAAAGDGPISDIRIEESWLYVLFGTSYCTTFTAVARGPAPPPPPPKVWHVSPRLGLSLTTGMIGVEAQYRHAGLAVGTLCVFGGCLGFGGLKYYVAPAGDSLALGPFVIWFGADDHEDRRYTEYHWGLLVEHRWRHRSGFEAALGVGAKLGDNDPDPHPDADDRWFAPSFSAGFAF